MSTTLKARDAAPSPGAETVKILKKQRGERRHELGVLLHQVLETALLEELRPAVSDNQASPSTRQDRKFARRMNEK